MSSMVEVLGLQDLADPAADLLQVQPGQARASAGTARSAGMKTT